MEINIIETRMNQFVGKYTPDASKDKIKELSLGFIGFINVIEELGVDKDELKDVLMKYKAENRYNEGIKNEEVYQKLKKNLKGTIGLTTRFYFDFMLYLERGSDE
ncbi:hypothetical protein 7AX1_97 [uncultured Caudovirales phage]|uniref:Uncharacterized protein n=1 Tax=uncultured Caudovirales phage TaxID=2100421 RepID=A0A2H4J3V9_9CAUD|nr:hypothetical protein 7AX1_97 [uncultured Caudovirales phage]